MAGINNIEKRLIKLETRYNRNLKDQNKVNAQDHKHILAMEKRFGKMDKTTRKINKQVDPLKLVARGALKGHPVEDFQPIWNSAAMRIARNLPRRPQFGCPLNLQNLHLCAHRWQCQDAGITGA